MLTLPKFARCTVSCVALMVATIPAQAQSLQETTALKFVPADVSFYSSSLRNGEHFAKFVNSRAFKKLRSLPFVQRSVEQLKSEFDSGGDMEQVRDFFDEPQNIELLKLMRDAVEDEIFFFGDNRFAVWISAMNQFGNSMNMARLNSLQSGQDPNEIIQQQLMQMLTANPAMLQAPSCVIGFRIDDGDRAKAQVNRLEAVLKQLIESRAPELKDRLKRESIGDASFLTLQLDGSLVPWAELLSEAELSEEQQQELIQKLEKVKLTIGLGLRGDYLLLSTGESLDQIQSLGQGKLLADTKELAPLKNAEGKPVTAISYVSGEFLRLISSVDQQIDQMANTVKAVLPMVPIAEDVKTEIQADAETFAKELKAQNPRNGIGHGLRIFHRGWIRIVQL